jgi:DNA-binding response OmpR family regulator
MAEAVGSTVMIVGVDSDFTYLIQYYVHKSGRQVLISSPDQEALDCAKREKPAVIVLEADGSDAAGWDVLRNLKADQATSHIPIVVCSWLDKGTSGLADRATCYLQKPILYGDFVAALENAGCADGYEGGIEGSVAMG